MKKSRILSIVIVIIVILLGGLYWRSQKAAISPPSSNSEIDMEGASLSQDIADMEEFNQEERLMDSIDRDLASISEEGMQDVQTAKDTAKESISVANISTLENLSNNLSYESDSFSSDLSDLKGFNNDTGLDNLDSGLSGI